MSDNRYYVNYTPRLGDAPFGAGPPLSNHFDGPFDSPRADSPVKSCELSPVMYRKTDQVGICYLTVSRKPLFDILQRVGRRD